MINFYVSYDIVTEESAAHGDYAEVGFVLHGGWRQELPAGVFGEAAGKIKDECALSLREALTLVSCVENDGGTSFYECDAQQDTHTGDYERRALHCPDSITGASLARVRRLLRNERLLLR